MKYHYQVGVIKSLAQTHRRQFIAAFALTFVLFWYAGLMMITQATPTGKVSLCHATGNGKYVLISVSEKALKGHSHHDDVSPGDIINEGSSVVGDDCTVTDRVMVGADTTGYVLPVTEEDCDLVADDDLHGLDAIQNKINEATGGETICVEDGEYYEFIVDKPITILGLSNPNDGTAKVIPSSSGVNELALVNSSDVTISGLLFHGNGTAFVGNQTAGVRISPTGGDIDNVHITYNVVKDLNRTATSGSNKGIQWHDGASGSSPVVAYSLTNSIIGHNVIDNIDSNKGSYGIQTVGDMDNVAIVNNTIRNIGDTLKLGTWGAGVALDSHEVDESLTSVMVVNNHIVDGNWYDVSVQVEHNVDQTGVVVNNNNLLKVVHGSAAPAAGLELNAESNWWGDTDPSDNVSGPVDYDPYQMTAFPTF